MTDEPVTTESEPADPDSRIYDATWQTKWIVVGVIVLCAWRLSVLVGGHWTTNPWVVLFATGVLPHVFLLAFPLLTTDRHLSPDTPAFFEAFAECRCALGVVTGTALAVAALYAGLEHLSPGIMQPPTVVSRVVTTQNPVVAYLFLFGAVCVAPVTEEVFFRGFLQNALRKRFNVVVAALVQSGLFGVAHFYGAPHMAVAAITGLVLTATYEWRKTLLTPIIVHAGINSLAAQGMLAAMSEYGNGPLLGVAAKPDEYYCVVGSVLPGSPAAEAGLKSDDLITAVDDIPVTTMQDLVDAIAFYVPSDTVVITFERDNQIHQVTVKLKRRSELFRR